MTYMYCTVGGRGCIHTDIGLVFFTGHDKMRSGANLRGASLLVSFDHVIDSHFVAFSSSLYTTICNPKPNLTLILTLTLTLTLTQT